MTDSTEPTRARARRNVHLTAEERVARGRSARTQAPRSAHGTWEASADRPDPIALLEEQAESRVPELVPIRYGRMLLSPFAFFRGAALIMAADLAPTPRSGINVQLCGDAHLSNFGLFGSPERQLLFDINDFDETLPGPWEWDVKRLAASIEVLGRERGFSPADRAGMVGAGIREYRLVLRHAATMGTLEAWYDHMDVDQVMSWVRTEVAEKRLHKRVAKRAEKDVAKARTRDSMHVFAKRADEIDGKLRIVSEPPLIVPIDELGLPHTDGGSGDDDSEQLMRSLVGKYRRSLADHHHPIEEFEYVHTARKVVGVGSVGTRAWIHLFVGRDDRGPAVPAVEGGRGVGPRTVRRQERLRPPRPARGGGPAADAGGQRHLPGLAAGQGPRRGDPRLLRAPAPRLEGERRGRRACGCRGRPLYARLCGATLARAHARWGDRIAIASYLGRGERVRRAIADFSAAYADQNERDYETFVKAVESGRLTAHAGL